VRRDGVEPGQLGDRRDPQRREDARAEHGVIELLPRHLGDSIGLGGGDPRAHRLAHERAEHARGRVLADHALLPVGPRGVEIARRHVRHGEAERRARGLASEYRGSSGAPRAAHARDAATAARRRRGGAPARRAPAVCLRATGAPILERHDPRAVRRRRRAHRARRARREPRSSARASATPIAASAIPPKPGDPRRHPDASRPRLGARDVLHRRHLHGPPKSNRRSRGRPRGVDDLHVEWFNQLRTVRSCARRRLRARPPSCGSFRAVRTRARGGIARARSARRGHVAGDDLAAGHGAAWGRWEIFQLAAIAAGGALFARAHGRGRTCRFGAGVVGAAALGAIAGSAGPWLAWLSTRDGAPPEIEVAGYGALAGLALGVAIVAGRRGTAPARALDELAPAIGIMLALARLGCFFAGCDFGAPSAVPWAIRYPRGDRRVRRAARRRSPRARRAAHTSPSTRRSSTRRSPASRSARSPF